MNEFEVARILIEHITKVRGDELRAAYPGMNVIVGPVPKYPRSTIIVRDEHSHILHSECIESIYSMVNPGIHRHQRHMATESEEFVLLLPDSLNYKGLPGFLIKDIQVHGGGDRVGAFIYNEGGGIKPYQPPSD
jgi:hypothetical protein